MPTTPINVAALTSAGIAKDVQIRWVLAAMELQYCTSGQVTVDLSACGQLTPDFLRATWGEFLRGAQSLAQAEDRHAHTTFHCGGDFRDLRHHLHTIGRDALHHHERAQFLTSQRGWQFPNPRTFFNGPAEF